jgi:hypothetical protein
MPCQCSRTLRTCPLGGLGSVSGPTLTEAAPSHPALLLAPASTHPRPGRRTRRCARRVTPCTACRPWQSCLRGSCSGGALRLAAARLCRAAAAAGLQLRRWTRSCWSLRPRRAPSASGERRRSSAPSAGTATRVGGACVAAPPGAAALPPGVFVWSAPLPSHSRVPHTLSLPPHDPCAFSARRPVQPAGRSRRPPAPAPLPVPQEDAALQARSGGAQRERAVAGCSRVAASGCSAASPFYPAPTCASFLPTHTNSCPPHTHTHIHTASALAGTAPSAGSAPT